jgi:hypothetical protein
MEKDKNRISEYKQAVYDTTGNIPVDCTLYGFENTVNPNSELITKH